MNGQTIIIILLSLIVAKLYPNLGYVALTIAALVIFAYAVKSFFSWLYKFDAVKVMLWPLTLAALAAIPVGIGYLIDIFYPSKTERWIMVLCFYAAGAFLLVFHWCFEKVNEYISRTKG